VVASGPVLAVLAPAALIGYSFSRRSRYFGNTAPLICVLLFVVLRAGSPHQAESVYSLTAATFVFVFVAGIAADAMETKAVGTLSAVLPGLLAANAIWNLIGVWNIGH